MNQESANEAVKQLIRTRIMATDAQTLEKRVDDAFAKVSQQIDGSIRAQPQVAPYTKGSRAPKAARGPSVVLSENGRAAVRKYGILKLANVSGTSYNTLRVALAGAPFTHKGLQDAILRELDVTSQDLMPEAK